MFRAIELSSITIQVQDLSGTPLQGVLLSLSGDQYRNHNATDAAGECVCMGCTAVTFIVQVLGIF